MSLLYENVATFSLSFLLVKMRSFDEKKRGGGEEAGLNPLSFEFDTIITKKDFHCFFGGVVFYGIILCECDVIK